MRHKRETNLGCCEPLRFGGCYPKLTVRAFFISFLGFYLLSSALPFLPILPPSCLHERLAHHYSRGRCYPLNQVFFPRLPLGLPLDATDLELGPCNYAKGFPFITTTTPLSETESSLYRMGDFGSGKQTCPGFQPSAAETEFSTGADLALN